MYQDNDFFCYKMEQIFNDDSPSENWSQTPTELPFDVLKIIMWNKLACVRELWNRLC